MDCMQFDIECGSVANKEFQYRKRYGLHAIPHKLNIRADDGVSIPQAVWIACNQVALGGQKDLRCFNTASGMDCMQFMEFVVDQNVRFVVSIPQAVWIACNDKCRPRSRSKRQRFQYRKRYGLHAIPSLTALGTAEPRSGFSKRIALLGESPRPRGIFLSPKSAENVRKPCNIKETFVHGKNLKLMAFSREFLPSL